jgi:hypothetical protein
MNDFTVTSEDRMEAIQRAMLAFMKTTPSFVLDEESGTYLTDYILEHGLNQFDPASYHAAYNARESVKRDRENRMAEWQRGRADYLRPSDEDKTQAIEDLKQRQQKPAPTPFVPARQYTDADLDRMTSDEYRKAVLGVTRLDDVQGNSGHVFKPALAPEGTRTGFRKPRLSLQARRLLGLDK